MNHVQRAIAVLSLITGCSSSSKTETVDAGPNTKDSGVQDAAVPVVGPVSLGDTPALGAKCMGKTKPGVTGPTPSFERKVISTQPGAGFIKPVDLNSDGFPEVLITALMEGPFTPGGGYVLSRDGGKPNGDIGTWTSTKVFNKDSTVKVDGEDLPINWPNMSDLLDVDNDGINDWVVATGFLPLPTALIVWMKGSAEGTFGAPKSMPLADRTCWYHHALPLDMDGDGDDDFVSTCHRGRFTDPDQVSRMHWFENPGDASGEFKLHEIGEGGGALISLHDLDADGDQDVLAAQFWGPESLVWFEQSGKHGTKWTKHVINDTTGRGFMTRVADMNGDGSVDLVYVNHNNEEAPDKEDQTMGVYWFEVPPADKLKTLANWDDYMHTIHEGFMNEGTGNGNTAGAPGMMNVGDVDGDCDMDVMVSGDGDPGLYLFVQQATSFEMKVLDTDPLNVNSGEQHLFDLDGDGDLDMLWTVFGPQAVNPFQSRISAFLQK